MLDEEYLQGVQEHVPRVDLLFGRLRAVTYFTVPQFFEPDWSVRSDCYVPIEGETDANRELAQLLESNRRLIFSEGGAPAG